MMIRVVMALVASLGLSACADMPVQRAAAPVADNVAVERVAPVDVRNVVVSVPDELTVSEVNSYYPTGDIVWREDPPGDRREQVKSIFEEGLRLGVDEFKNGREVDIVVEVRRFHALTQKARYTIGGVHAITFDLEIQDAVTGKALTPPRRVEADLRAFGGQLAVEAEAVGITQKSRITEHLAVVIQDELNSPDGYQNQDLGFYQRINRR